MTVDLNMEKLNLTITSMASAQVTFTFEDILNLYEQVQAKYKFDEVLINQSRVPYPSWTLETMDRH